MMMSTKTRFTLPGAILAVALLLGLAPSGASAQIPDEFTNLKVLPEDIDKRVLVGTMRGFAGALGVRCNHCHVGEDPDSLQGYDFASDEKETKRTARVMLQMVQAINADYLPKTGREELIEVRCASCHRGLLEPESLDRLMMATIAADGVDAGMAQYRELREEHYGAGRYDFGPTALDGVTERLAMGQQDFDGAMAINQLNLEYHPESDYSLYLHARLLLRQGDRDGAIAALEKAIAANPDEGWLQEQLDELLNPPAEQ